MPSPAARFWCVDPLDGTKEFIARNGEFAVLIALIEHGVPVLGVVHGPAVGVDLCRARTGHGDAAARRRRVRADPGARRRRRTGSSSSTAEVHENSRRLAEYSRRTARCVERKQCGSALKFGVLAAGEADFYPRFGTTMEWDTAAGQAVLEAAGGHVFGLDGAPLGYGKPGLKNDGFLAWGEAGVVSRPAIGFALTSFSYIC